MVILVCYKIIGSVDPSEAGSEEVALPRFSWLSVLDLLFFSFLFFFFCIIHIYLTQYNIAFLFLIIFETSW